MQIFESRTQKIVEKFSPLANKFPINFSLLTTAKLPNGRGYFSQSIDEDFLGLEDAGFKFCPFKGLKELQDIDVLIITAHGDGISELIFELREKNPNLILAIWFFDNHIAYLPNYKTAVIADIYYPSHSYCKDYLVNPFSPIGVPLPACAAQWSLHQFDFKSILSSTKRESKLFLNYVDYKFSWRSEVLNLLNKHMPDAHVELMSSENRDRYFSLTALEKYQEWCSYKATLILPVDRDLSTRVFDALLAGQVLIVPTMIDDFDKVISKDWQSRLGIIRVKDLDLTTIKFAAKKAFEIFDQRDLGGMLARFEFISKEHMLVNRVETILKNIKSISRAEARIHYKLTSDDGGLFVE